MKTKNKWLILAGLAAVNRAVRRVRPESWRRSAALYRQSGTGRDRRCREATGSINAVITVPVGSQVSGTIAKLNVDFNSRVHKGDVVALIDPALFKGALLQASAELDNAKANVAAAKANLEKAKAVSQQTR